MSIISPEGLSTQQATAAELLAKIDQRSARIGVIGLGYVGLPLAQIGRASCRERV